MKRSRFTEEQIIAALREQGRVCSKQWDQPAVVYETDENAVDLPAEFLV